MLQSLSSLIWFIITYKYTKDGNLVSEKILEKVQPGAALSQSSRYLSFFPRTSQVISSGHQFSERDELLSEFPLIRSGFRFELGQVMHSFKILQSVLL